MSSPHPCVQNDVTPTRKHVICIRRFSPEVQGKLSTYARFSLEIAGFLITVSTDSTIKTAQRAEKFPPK